MDIVDQIRADRENGAICLEREYKSRLMAVAVKLCRDRTEAEVLVYQAFAEAVRRIDDAHGLCAWRDRVPLALRRQAG